MIHRPVSAVWSETAQNHLGFRVLAKICLTSQCFNLQAPLTFSRWPPQSCDSGQPHVDSVPIFLLSVGEWGEEYGKQVGSMDEESQVRGCYNICTPTRKQCRLSPEMNTGRNSKQTTCLCRDTGGKGTLRAQRTGFNILDNWAIQLPSNQKGKGPHWKHVYNTLGYIRINELLWKSKDYSIVVVLSVCFSDGAQIWNSFSFAFPLLPQLRVPPCL